MCLLCSLKEEHITRLEAQVDFLMQEYYNLYYKLPKREQCEDLPDEVKS